MKKKGNVVQHNGARDTELYCVFMNLLMNSRGVALRELYGLSAKRGCSRFWVSEERAYEVVRRLRRGESFPDLTESRRRMYAEIAERVDAIMKRDPEMPLLHAVRQVVNGPAPEFYLTAETVKTLVNRRRRALKEARRERRLSQR